MDRKALKMSAKESLRGCKTNPYLITIAFLVIVGLISYLTGADTEETIYESFSLQSSLLRVVGGIVSCIAGAGYTWWAMSIARGEDNTDEFKLAILKIIPVALVQIVCTVLIGIGMFLLVVPGIILSFGLAMATLCLRDNFEDGFAGAIKSSWNIMKGHKWEYFVLSLSFIPWILLSVITLGIALIYVAPYMEVTFAKYYDAIKNN